jgi:hypothetical protein
MDWLLVVLSAFTVRARTAHAIPHAAQGRNSRALAPALRFATRAFGTPHIRHECRTSSHQAASVLERMTFAEGAGLPQRL